MRNLVLIGFMASGKSTIGRECARVLGFRFVDTDAIIEERAGRPIRELFAESGEAAFRALEAEAVREAACGDDRVIATGGGAPLDPRNADCLRAGGVVVLLDTTPETVLRRVGDRTTRPLLAAAEDPLAVIRSMLADREPRYREVAHAVIPTSGRRRRQVVNAVLSAYRARAGEECQTG